MTVGSSAQSCPLGSAATCCHFGLSPFEGLLTVSCVCVCLPLSLPPSLSVCLSVCLSACVCVASSELQDVTMILHAVVKLDLAFVRGNALHPREELLLKLLYKRASMLHQSFQPKVTPNPKPFTPNPEIQPLCFTRTLGSTPLLHPNDQGTRTITRQTPLTGIYRCFFPSCPYACVLQEVAAILWASGTLHRRARMLTPFQLPSLMLLQVSPTPTPMLLQVSPTPSPPAPQPSSFPVSPPIAL